MYQMKNVIKICIYTLIILVPLRFEIYAEDCTTLPSFSPIWLNAQSFAVSGCNGIQIYSDELIPETFIETDSAWFLSPSYDGKWFVAYGNGNMYIYDTDEYEPKYYIEGGSPSWSKYENKISFSSNANGYESINVFDVDEGMLEFEQILQHFPSRITWKADNLIQYIGIGNFEVYEWYLGEQPEIIFETSMSIDWSIFVNDIWSPDNQEFVFMSHPMINESGQLDLPLIGMNNIVDDTIKHIKSDDFQILPHMHIVWHQEGDFFAISNSYAVYLFNTNTLKLVEIFPSNNRDNLHRIELNDCEGRGTREINYWIDWHPDGKRLLVSSYCAIEVIQVFE